MTEQKLLLSLHHQNFKTKDDKTKNNNNGRFIGVVHVMFKR